jgi:hypothetical protein
MHLTQLARAEQLLRSGPKKIADGLMVVGNLHGQDAERFRASLEGPIVPVRNLRNLCQESLKPRSWLTSASLKFVAVFLVTAVILVIVVAATNANQGIGGGVLTGYVLLVSFVAALIGGFGVEALRFLPLAKLLSQSRPAAPKPADSTEGESGVNTNVRI